MGVNGQTTPIWRCMAVRHGCDTSVALSWLILLGQMERHFEMRRFSNRHRHLLSLGRTATRLPIKVRNRVPATLAAAVVLGMPPRRIHNPLVGGHRLPGGA